MRLVSPEVDDGRIENVLHTRAELVFALRKHWNWEKSKEHARNEKNGFPLHIIPSDEK